LLRLSLSATSNKQLLRVEGGKVIDFEAERFENNRTRWDCRRGW
jgi:hypothetical protein